MHPPRELISLEDFDTSPFPLRHGRSAAGRPFFDQRDGTRRGRTTRHGTVLWEDQTYSDSSVLLCVPANFDATRPATLVVYLHGNRARLERDVIKRQQLPRQVRDADINALLIAPQFALDAPDSSAGRFALRGVFQCFLAEAARKLEHLCCARDFSVRINSQLQSNAHQLADLCRERDGPSPRLGLLQEASVIVIAYSGGYCPAAAALSVGGARARVRGVVLLDALYDHEALFAAWLHGRRRHAFLVSAYTHGTRSRNVQLRAQLRDRQLVYTLGLTTRLAVGTACLVPLDGSIDHADVVTRAWCEDPVTDILRRAGPGLDTLGAARAPHG